MGFVLSWWLLPPLRRPERRRLDPYGVLTLTVAVSTLLLALTQGNREGWDSQYILTLLAIAGVAGVAFVVVELCHPEPLVELRLFGSLPFVMAMIVLFLTTMTFRGSGPMISVLQQRLLHFEPLLVAWTQMLPNLVYGAMVLVVGRISDRVPCHVLVISGLLVYAAGFWGYAGLNEITTVAMIMPFLMIRFVAEAFIVSPNNLATLQALPENKVYMATALSGLLRSIANTMGTAIATVVLDQRYNYSPPAVCRGDPPGCLRIYRSPRWRATDAAMVRGGRGANSDPDAGLDTRPSGGGSQHGSLAGLFCVQCLSGSPVPVPCPALLAPGEVSCSGPA